MVSFAQLPAGVQDKIFLHMTGKIWECMRCQSKGKLHVFSVERQWDRLHTAGFLQPGFNIEGVQLLCHACRAQWLEWEARMGFDLHSHAIVAPCDNDCFSALHGRRAQFLALQSAGADSKIGFVMAKAIDGMPKQNGTTGVMCHRILYFRGGGFHRQGYYESVKAPEELALNLEKIAHLRSIGVAPYMVDYQAIVVKVFKSAYTAPGGVLQPPGNADPLIDLHCVGLEGFDPVTKTFRFRNNWGSNWGDHGHGIMSMEYANEFFHEGWICRHARWGQTPEKEARLAAASGDRVRLRQLWSVENPRFIERIPGAVRGYNFRWQWHETTSPTLGCPVACVEIKNGFGLRMGWAFTRRITDSVAEITELFVWPTFRRAHIGTMLEGLCYGQAAIWGVQELQLIVNEADSVVGPIRHGARHFAKAQGYSERWRIRTAPRSGLTCLKPVTATPVEP